jgi:hypothetical protein
MWRRVASGMPPGGLRYRARGMGIASRAVGRLCIPFVAGTLLLAAASVTGCSGGDDTSSTGDAQHATPSAKSFPATRNRSFRVLIGAMLQGPVLAPSVSVLTPGRNRFGFALFDRGNRQIGELDVALYISKGLDETARGPYPARYEQLDVKPQFRSQTTAQDPESAQSVYVAQIPFPSAGTYQVSAVAKLDRKLVATSPAQVAVRGSTSVPSVGDRAISVHTPTVASAHGDVKSIDTRVPPDDMHGVDLVEALKRHRPVVLLFATPALCQSRVCGPVADVTEQVKAEFGDKLDFIHMEIYQDNDVNKGPRPQIPAWGLCSGSGKSYTCTEPWLFTIDKRGRVAARIQGAFSVTELEEAVRRALR